MTRILHSVTIVGMFAIEPMVLSPLIRSETYVIEDLLKFWRLYGPCTPWTPLYMLFQSDEIGCSITKYIWVRQEFMGATKTELYMEAFSWCPGFSISAKVWLLKYPVGSCAKLDQQWAHTPGNSVAWVGLASFFPQALGNTQQHEHSTWRIAFASGRFDISVPPHHMENPSRLSFRFFSTAVRQNPERKAWVQG